MTLTFIDNKLYIHIQYVILFLLSNGIIYLTTCLLYTSTLYFSRASNNQLIQGMSAE